MTEEIKKKGMSKGCMIGLIVGLVIIIIIAALMVTCYMKKDELAKFGAVTVLNGSKQMLVENPVEGVDTVQFNAMIDEFVERFQAEEELDYVKAEKLFLSMQTIPSDKTIDSAEVEMLIDALVTYYPDLGADIMVQPESMEPDSSVITDSM